VADFEADAGVEIVSDPEMDSGEAGFGDWDFEKASDRHRNREIESAHVNQRQVLRNDPEAQGRTWQTRNQRRYRSVVKK